MPRRALISCLLVLFLCCCPSVMRAQQVVIDPSQIASSAANAAEQIDFMVDQLGELTSLTDKLAGVKSYIDNVFGEEGVGGKTISVLEDLGTLQRLTEAFNSNVRMFQQYSEYLKSAERYGIGDVNDLLSYLTTSKRNAEQAIEVAKRIIATMGFTKKEKKDEIEALTLQMDQSLSRLQTAIDIELQTSIDAKGFCEFIDYIDDNAGARQYVDSLKEYGSPQRAASGSMDVILILMYLLGAVSTLWGVIVFLKGGSGDSFSELVFIRVGVAIIGSVFILNIISICFGL